EVLLHHGRDSRDVGEVEHDDPRADLVLYLLHRIAVLGIATFFPALGLFDEAVDALRPGGDPIDPPDAFECPAEVLLDSPGQRNESARVECGILLAHVRWAHGLLRSFSSTTRPSVANRCRPSAAVSRVNTSSNLGAGAVRMPPLSSSTVRKGSRRSNSPASTR